MNKNNSNSFCYTVLHRRTVSTFVVGLSLWLGFAGVSRGATIYVSTTGNDSWDGSSPTTSYRTVAKAHAKAAPAGDTISIQSGVYLETVALTKHVTLVNRDGSAFIGACPYLGIGIAGNRNLQTTICKTNATNPNPATDVRLSLSAFDGCGQSLAETQVQISWSQPTNGPGPVTFANPNSLVTTAQFTKPGVFNLPLQVTRNGFVGRFVVNVTVTEVTCSDPIGTSSAFQVSAGPDVRGSITTGVTLAGSATRGGTKLAPPQIAVMWTNLSPNVGSVIFQPTNALTNTAQFSRAGTYTVQLVATEVDGSRRTTNDTAVVVITNSATPACILTVNPGPDIYLQLPQGTKPSVSASLAGQILLNGLPTNAAPTWTVPTGVAISDPHVLKPTVIFTNAGTFSLKLCATDPCAGTACSNLTVHVNGACPVVSAGGDQTLLLDDVGSSTPVCTTLFGSVNPSAGASIRWAQVTGSMSGISFSSVNATNPTVCFTQPGTNVLRLSASMGTCTNSDDVVVIVKYAAKHYLTWKIVSDPFCCGTSFDIMNVHPTCPIEAVIQPVKCISESGTNQARTITFNPGVKQTICTGGSFQILSARFVCSPQILAAEVPSEQKPAALIIDLQRVGEMIEFALQGIPGAEYSLEASEDLVDWQSITNVTCGQKPLRIRDVDSKSHSRRFYRAVAK